MTPGVTKWAVRDELGEPDPKTWRSGTRNFNCFIV